MDERLLATRCCRHDRAALGELYALYAPRLRAMCLRYVSVHDDAEDLMQDAFVRILTSLDHFQWRGEGSLWMWMKRITANLAVDRIRRQPEMVRMGADEELLPDEEPTASDVDQLSEETLLGFIAALPVGYRTVFNLVCMEGMSHREAAHLMGIGEKSSSSQLSHARAMLAKKIKVYLEQEERTFDCKSERI